MVSVRNVLDSVNACDDAIMWAEECFGNRIYETDTDVIEDTKTLWDSCHRPEWLLYIILKIDALLAYRTVLYLVQMQFYKVINTNNKDYDLYATMMSRCEEHLRDTSYAPTSKLASAVPNYHEFVPAWAHSVLCTDGFKSFYIFMREYEHEFICVFHERVHGLSVLWECVYGKDASKKLADTIREMFTFEFVFDNVVNTHRLLLCLRFSMLCLPHGRHTYRSDPSQRQRLVCAHLLKLRRLGCGNKQSSAGL